MGINGTITSQMNELMAILDIPQETRSFEKFRTTLKKLKEAFKFIIKGEKNVQMLLERATSNSIDDDKALEETKQKLQEANQNLTTQVEARNNLVYQQNILMDILEIPKDQRHFEIFRQRILSNQEELKNFKLSIDKENDADADSKDFTSTLDLSSISQNS